MAQFGWSQATSVLQEHYKPLLEQFNDFSFFISQLETDTENIEFSDGARAYHPIRTGRNSGVGARGPGGTVPTPGYQSYSKILIPIRKNYAVCRINSDVIDAMKSGEHAWFQAVDMEVTKARTDATKDRNRQAYGTSNGVIAQCGTTTTSATIVLATTTTQTQMRQLGSWDGGMVVDIGTVASPTTIAEARTITAWDTTAGACTITVSGATVSTTSSHYIFRSGSGGASDDTGVANDGQKELTGLQDAISATSVLHTVNPSTVPSWAAYVNSNSGTNRAWSESLMNKTIAEAESRSGVQVDLIIGNPKVNNTIAAQFSPSRRYNDTVDLKAGWTGMAYSTPLEGMQGATQRVLVGDHFCPENQLFGLATNTVKRYQTHDWKFVDDDGSPMWRSPDRDDSFEVWLRIRDEIAYTHRAANFLLSDLEQA